MKLFAILGAIAMLGPGPADSTDTANIPLHMLVSSQKLHPGSGCLTVRVQMDGPVRVLQIADIRHRVGSFRVLLAVFKIWPVLKNVSLQNQVMFRH